MIKLVKIVVSIALLTLLLVNVQWSDIWLQISSMNVTWVLITFTIMVTGLPISAWKWGKALEIHRLEYTFGFLQKILCISVFFNNFLPSSVGGDLYRVVRTMPKEGRKSQALSALLLDRLLGLGILLILGYAGGLANLLNGGTEIASYYILICSLGGGILLVLVLLFRSGLLLGLREKLLHMKKLDPVVENARYICNGGKALLAVVVISLLYQLLAISTVYTLFVSIDTTIGFWNCALITTVSGLVALLPISINGIGVVEGSFVFVATQFGVELNHAVIVALALRAMTIPLSAACGLVYLYELRQS